MRNGNDPGVDGELTRLVALAFRSRRHPPVATGAVDANAGRGVFSRVARIELTWPGTAATSRPRPPSVVAKLPAEGPNGAAAIATGACRREALAYGRILPVSPITAPRAWLVDHGADGSIRFVLEDLSGLRAVDQLDGLEPADAIAVAHALGRFHRRWAPPSRHGSLAVRHATPAALAPDALAAGLEAVRRRWEAAVPDHLLATFERLLARRSRLVEAFAAAGPPTLCHGDPRADNLVFAPDGTPVLFDWQQVAVQFGAADVAWLAATSLDPDQRRASEPDLVGAAGTTFDSYRLGLVLPGLAVLLLAQRETPSDRAAAFVATSLRRIATALDDLEVHRAA